MSINKYKNSNIQVDRVLALNAYNEKYNERTNIDEIRVTQNGIDIDFENIDKNLCEIVLMSQNIIVMAKEGNDLVFQIYRPTKSIENNCYNTVPINLLDIISINGAEMEVTKHGGKYTEREHKYFPPKDNILKKEEFFLSVKKEGIIKKSNTLIHIPRIFHFKIITIVNQPINSEYIDFSGCEIKSILEMYFRNVNRQINIDYNIISAKEDLLKQELEEALDQEYDVIFTIGGTGVGPGDITFDVVNNMCDKVLPGIMEFIRVKYGQNNSHALLSRSIAGIIKNTVIYTIPGSKKAVIEYMQVILDTMEHLIYVMNGLSH